jgi:hypothetical protein
MGKKVLHAVVLTLCALILTSCGCSGACMKASGGLAVGVGGFFYCIFHHCQPVSTY